MKMKIGIVLRIGIPCLNFQLAIAWHEHLCIVVLYR